MLARIVPGSRQKQWAAVVLALIFFGIAGATSYDLPDRLGGGGWLATGSDSAHAVDLLKEGFTTRGEEDFAVLVHDTRYTASDPEFATRAAAATQSVLDDPRVGATGNFGWLSASDQLRPRFTGEDTRTVVTTVASHFDDNALVNDLPGVQSDLDERWLDEGLQISLVGASAFWGEVNSLSQQGLLVGEAIVFPLILIVLLLLYRSVAAALVSFVVIGATMAWTFGALGILSRFVELSTFVQNSAMMIGIGVGVDYALFIIIRYRDGILAGLEPLEAVREAVRTSGRTVAVSAVVIVFSAATLLLVPLPAVKSIGLGVMLAAVFAALAALLLLPSVLALLGTRALAWNLGLKFPDPSRTGGRWGAFAATVMRRPVVFLAVTVTVMLALALPALGLRTNTPDTRIVSAESSVRVGYDTLADQFGPGATAPIVVVFEAEQPIDTLAGRQDLVALIDTFDDIAHVRSVESASTALATVAPGDPLAALADTANLPTDLRQVVGHYVSTDRHKLVVEIHSDSADSTDESRSIVTTLRAQLENLPPGITGVAVGGQSAIGIDTNDAIVQALPGILALMLGVIFIVLLIAFRSLLLPIKAILVNLLSLATTFGILMAIFRYGFGADLLGFEQVGYLQNFVPALLLVILFGLSTDYELFVLNRVREEYLRTGDNEQSVQRGVALTAPLVSGAAILMMAVFFGFALASILPLQQFGFGLAIGVLIDATVVRLIVVPAAMRLMGRWNWWLPGRPIPAPAPAAQPAATETKETLV